MDLGRSEVALLKVVLNQPLDHRYPVIAAGSSVIQRVSEAGPQLLDRLTVAVDNLNDFVRDHMLEPFDAAKWTAGIVAHFEDLTKAHEAVQRAQAQLTALEPLLAECRAHDKVSAGISALTAEPISRPG